MCDNYFTWKKVVDAEHVGFGDQVVPEPQPSEFPALLADHGPVVRANSPETVVAEKFNAMVVRGMANSRMKDYFDIWMLTRRFTIEEAALRQAILQTFAKRQTPMPEAEPIGLSDEFSSNESKRLQWQGYTSVGEYLDTPPDAPATPACFRRFSL